MKKGMLLIVLFVVILGGCYRHAYDVGTGAPNGHLVYDHWEHKFIFGLANANNKHLDVKKSCPSGNATVKDQISFLNGLVGFLTVGIYTPTNVMVHCDTTEESENSDQ